MNCSLLTLPAEVQGNIYSYCQMIPLSSTCKTVRGIIDEVPQLREKYISEIARNAIFKMLPDANLTIDLLDDVADFVETEEERKYLLSQIEGILGKYRWAYMNGTGSLEPLLYSLSVAFRLGRPIETTFVDLRKYASSCYQKVLLPMLSIADAKQKKEIDQRMRNLNWRLDDHNSARLHIVRAGIYPNEYSSTKRVLMTVRELTRSKQNLKLINELVIYLIERGSYDLAEHQIKTLTSDFEENNGEVCCQIATVAVKAGLFELAEEIVEKIRSYTYRTKGWAALSRISTRSGHIRLGADYLNLAKKEFELLKDEIDYTGSVNPWIDKAEMFLEELDQLKHRLQKGEQKSIALRVFAKRVKQLDDIETGFGQLESHFDARIFGTLLVKEIGFKPSALFERTKTLETDKKIQVLINLRSYLWKMRAAHHTEHK